MLRMTYRDLKRLFWAAGVLTDAPWIKKKRTNERGERQTAFLSALRPYGVGKSQIEFIQFVHTLNRAEETKESVAQMLITLCEDGWILLHGENEQIQIQYIPGDDDALWKRRDWMKDEDRRRVNIHHMLHGVLPKDQMVLDDLRAHAQGSTVRQITGRVFGEDESVTTLMVRDCLEWLMEKKLVTMEEDENGHLLFRAAEPNEGEKEPT